MNENTVGRDLLAAIKSTTIRHKRALTDGEVRALIDFTAPGGVGRCVAALQAISALVASKGAT